MSTGQRLDSIAIGHGAADGLGIEQRTTTIGYSAFVNEPEKFLLDFHAQHPGCTSQAFASGRTQDGGSSSYGLLAELADSSRVLDLGAGDGHLLRLLAEAGHTRCTGLDFSPDELALARRSSPGQPLVRGRAQQLPFCGSSFSLVLSHFAFHLMADPTRVVSEIGRVLSPSGRFAAIVGGGPKVGDAFELFLDLMLACRKEDQRLPRIGAAETRTNEGLGQLFADSPVFASELEIEEYYVDFGGSFDEVWTRVATVYDLRYFTTEQSAALRERFEKELGAKAGAHIPCTMAIRRVLATRR